MLIAIAIALVIGAAGGAFVGYRYGAKAVSTATAVGKAL